MDIYWCNPLECRLYALYIRPPLSTSTTILSWFRAAADARTRTCARADIASHDTVIHYLVIFSQDIVECTLISNASCGVKTRCVRLSNLNGQ